MKIGLYHSISDKVNGCTKVVNNLRSGLSLLGHTIVHNNKGDLTGCLQGLNPLFRMQIDKDILIGPEIVVLPTEQPQLFANYFSWVQPAQWVINYMREFVITQKCMMYEWPSGIDSGRFTDSDRNPIKDCFIYYKNVTKQTSLEKLESVKKVISNLGLSYEVISYGSYTEDQLIRLTKQCKFAVWLCGSESQNIALMEVLSSGVPIYVVDETEFKYSNFSFIGCSSAPYFDDRCGIKCTDMSKIEEFITNINKYNPRQYILENHTIVKGAQKYIDILESTQR